MTRAERLARVRALIDDLRARARAAMGDIGGDGSPGAYFTGYARIALDEIDALLVVEEREQIEHQEKQLAVVIDLPRRARPAVAAGGTR